MKEMLETMQPPVMKPEKKAKSKAGYAAAGIGVAALVIGFGLGAVAAPEAVTTPGPTVTETVQVPGPVKTVTVPGPTITTVVVHQACLAAMASADKVTAATSQAFLLLDQQSEAVMNGDYDKATNLADLLTKVRADVLAPELVTFATLEAECVDAK